MLHVVLRGVPEPLLAKDVKTELTEMGYHPQSVVRMKRRDQTPLPLVLVIRPKAEKQIFELKSILQIVITVETQHQKASSIWACTKSLHSETKMRVLCRGSSHLRT